MINEGLVQSTFPVAYILLDCCQPERDEEFLQVSLHTIKELMANCELNFFAYKTPSDLTTTCLKIIQSFCGKATSPVQFIWVSYIDFVNFGDDAALSILSLHAALSMYSTAQFRSILLRGVDETDVSFQWSLMLDAMSINLVDANTAMAGSEWLVGFLECDGHDYSMYSDPFSPLPRLSHERGVLLGSMERSTAEPFLESQYATLSGDMSFLEGQSIILRVGSCLYFLEPVNGGSGVWTPVIECFQGCLMKRLQPLSNNKMRNAIESQARTAQKDDKSSPSPLVDKSVDVKSVKEQNKAALKKLLLLSLRKAGISTSSKEFSSTWKHLYCGCIFALRKELDRVKIEQSTLISIIQANMRTFNIK